MTTTAPILTIILLIAAHGAQFPLKIVRLGNTVLPFHGFIFDPPSRGYLCKFNNNYDCSHFKSADHFSVQYNRTHIFPNTLSHPWRRIDLNDYMHYHNETHARLTLHWHDAPDIPHINEYLLLETTHRLLIDLVHKIEVPIPPFRQTLLPWPFDTNKTIHARTFMSQSSFIVSVPHFVAYEKLYRFGSLTALWFGTNRYEYAGAESDTSILQIIDYYYEHGRNSSHDEQMEKTAKFFNCPHTFDRPICAQKSWTVAACNTLYFYKCDKSGAPQTLAKCSPYYRSNVTDSQECQTMDVLLHP